MRVDHPAELTAAKRTVVYRASGVEPGASGAPSPEIGWWTMVDMLSELDPWRTVVALPVCGEEDDDEDFLEDEEEFDDDFEDDDFLEDEEEVEEGGDLDDEDMDDDEL